eukprot:169091_1
MNEIILILKADNYIIFEELIIDNASRKKIIEYMFKNNWDKSAMENMDPNSFSDKISLHLNNIEIKSKLKLLYHKICDRLVEKDDEKAQEIRYLAGETKGNMQSNSHAATIALHNSESDIYEEDNYAFEYEVADWGDIANAKEIDTTIASYATEERKESKDKSEDEWKCKCGYINKRLSAVKNDFKCIKCNEPLNINEQEKKGNDNDILLQIDIDREIAMSLEQKTQTQYNNDYISHTKNIPPNNSTIIYMLQKDNYIIFKNLITNSTDITKIIEWVRKNNWNDEQIRKMSMNNFVKNISDQLHIAVTKTSKRILKWLYYRICDKIYSKQICYKCGNV